MITHEELEEIIRKMLYNQFVSEFRVEEGVNQHPKYSSFGRFLYEEYGPAARTLDPGV